MGLPRLSSNPLQKVNLGSSGLSSIIFKAGEGLKKKVDPRNFNPFTAQKRVLRKQLRKAANTDFGREYNFRGILESDDFVKVYQKQVPIHGYGEMFKWWQRLLKGESDVTWPGKTTYFALSSGTSEGSSKYIPVTNAMLKTIQRVGVRQMTALRNCNIKPEFFQRDILMLGGSTDLENNGVYYAGDLSGITTGRIPFWFRPFYKPGKEISKTKNWEEKLNKIVVEAHSWDVGAIVGVPAWLQLVIERVIEHYNLKNIHEIWPNLQLFVHGGISFEPYKKSFNKLLGKPITFLETYLASEGFFAYQTHPDSEGMRLYVKKGIFFEFIPFNDKNFNDEGRLVEDPEVLTIQEVEEKQQYALVISTCSGAWRYLIGDVIKFIDKDKLEIKITGRTKHYLSLCGEHLSVENMNRAVEMLADKFDLSIKEFTVAGLTEDEHFGHHWFLGIQKDVDLNYDEVKAYLDECLKELNDDYKTERDHFLSILKLDIVDSEVFRKWLKEQGKEGAQVKFPRVLRGDQIASWKSFLKTEQKEKEVSNI